MSVCRRNRSVRHRPSLDCGGLHRLAVEVADRNLAQVNVLERADVDRRHLISLGIDAFAKRMDAALGAEMMFDDVLIERIGAQD